MLAATRVDRFLVLLLGGLVCASCGNESPLGPSQTDAPRSGQAGAGSPERAGKERGETATGPAVPVLYDARERTRLPPGVEREPKLSPDTEKLIRAALSESQGRREDCPDPEALIVRATASAPGSFTAPATRQVAFILASAACGPGDAEAPEASQLVVVEGDKVVLHAAGTKALAGEPSPFFGTEIRAVADVDHDGVNELLVTASDASEAGRTETARLYSLMDGELTVLSEFPEVYVNGCVAGPHGQVRAQVIHHRAGAKDAASRYTTEPYQAACPASGEPAAADFQPVKPPASPTPAPSASPTATPSAAPEEPQGSR
jgi:hypothetical protein